MRYVAIASPAFAKKRLPQGLTPHTFRDVPFVAFNRKDDTHAEFVGRAFGLKRVTLDQVFVPSSEGQVRAVLSGWGVSVVPQLLVKGLIAEKRLVNLLPEFSLPIRLYWHCWNLDSEVLAQLTGAIKKTAGSVLEAAS
jgi:LysR family transcriptional regulator (chromosome initiation inhibitor)